MNPPSSYCFLVFCVADIKTKLRKLCLQSYVATWLQHNTFLVHLFKYILQIIIGFTKICNMENPTSFLTVINCTYLLNEVIIPKRYCLTNAKSIEFT